MGTIIGGHISLESIMKSRSRKILHIYFDKLRLETVKRSDFHFPEKKQYERITEFASKYSVPISYLTDSEFAELTGGLRRHCRRGRGTYIFRFPHCYFGK